MKGPETRVVLHASATATRQEAGLRLSLGTLALGSAIWLAVLPGRVTKLAALLALPLALLMIRRGLRALREPPRKERLELDPVGLLLTAPEGDTRVEWSNVRSVELDEDRLVVCVIKRDGGEIAIEPRYSGVPLRELAETVAAFRTRALGSKEAPSEPDARPSAGG